MLHPLSRRVELVCVHVNLTDAREKGHAGEDIDLM